MKKENIKENFVSISEAAKITDSTYPRIYALYRKKRIQYQEDDGNVYVNLIDVKKYVASHPEKRKDIVWDNVAPMVKEAFFPLTGFDYKYFSTSEGRLFNMTTGEELINEPRKTDGYIQVIIMKDTIEKNEYHHRLVAAACYYLLFGCKTSAEFLEKSYYDVHHIYIGEEGKQRNKPEDLLIVDTRIVYYENGKELNQHQKLHQLWDDGKKKEYWQMVKDIRKKYSKELFKIPHPDFEADDNFSYYIWVDARGKKAYDNKKEIPVKSIFRESAEPRKTNEGA